MPPETLPLIQRASYSKLLEDVRRVMNEGRARARRAVEKEKVATYWRMGRLVNEYLRKRGRAYGKQLIPQLASDLGMSERLLYEISNFQRVFPIPQTSAELAWSHYSALSRVDDAEERNHLLRQVIRYNWSARELTERIERRRLAVGTNSKPSPYAFTLKPRRGSLYTYRIVKPRDLHPRPDFYSIDLGLRNRIDWKLARLRGLKEGSVIEVIRTEEHSHGDRYQIRKSERPPGALYTYKARVTVVRDADTQWFDIDLGFRLWAARKLRLRGINAAEMEDGGMKAAAYVRKVLSKAAFVVVKLSGRDKFDRPLADLFYLEGEEDPAKVVAAGNFLNEELLRLGLAVPA